MTIESVARGSNLEMAGVSGARRRSRTLRMLRRNKMAVVGGCILLLSLASALLAPIVSPYDPTKMDLASTLGPPSGAHILGTDSFGRDVLSRILYGAQISLTIGLCSVGWAALIGIGVGLVAGYSRGLIGNLLMRMMDALLSFPPLLLAIAISGSFKTGMANVIFALGLIYVPVFARLARGSTLSLREEEFVTAAESYGAGSTRIILRHILPNLVGVIVVQATLSFAAVILAEATLSFLGLGVQPPTASWGRDLSEGRAYMQRAPWLVVFPSLLLVVNVLGINFLGDGLRDALDPRMRTRN